MNTHRLDTVDWLLIGYCIGFVVWWLGDLLEQAQQADTAVQRGQVTLTERALERLEDGDHLTISRWHGGDLEITGGEVITTERVDDSDED